MRQRISGTSFSDEQTRAAIREVKSVYGYEIDPHGAVAWLAARQWRTARPGAITIVLETAHPAKFPEVMHEEIGEVEIPERLAVLAEKEKHAIALPADEAKIKEWLAGI